MNNSFNDNKLVIYKYRILMTYLICYHYPYYFI